MNTNFKIKQRTAQFVTIEYMGNTCIINKEEPDKMMVVNTLCIQDVPEEIREYLSDLLSLLDYKYSQEKNKKENQC